MAAEDFAFLAQEVPGAFVFLGSGSSALGTDVSLHNPRFQVRGGSTWCFLGLRRGKGARSRMSGVSCSLAWWPQLDESVLALGVALHVGTALELLRSFHAA